MASNLGVNVIPWGADISTFVPKYLNIKRGMYLSYCIAICINPWKILTSATSFLRFLGGYSIFLGPFVGIALTDYLVVRKGNVYVQELYTSDPKGRYWYSYGVNWRACVAYVVAVVLPIPGFASLFGSNVPGVWLKIYQIGWLLGCTLSSVIYFALSFIGDMATEEKTMEFEAEADNVCLGGVEDVEAVPTAYTGKE